MGASFIVRLPRGIYAASMVSQPGPTAHIRNHATRRAHGRAARLLPDDEARDSKKLCSVREILVDAEILSTYAGRRLSQARLDPQVHILRQSLGGGGAWWVVSDKAVRTAFLHLVVMGMCSERPFLPIAAATQTEVSKHGLTAVVVGEGRGRSTRSEAQLQSTLC